MLRHLKSLAPLIGSQAVTCDNFAGKTQDLLSRF